MSEIKPESVNIVQLIENNPLSYLSDEYQIELLEEIKKDFTNDEQKIFLTSFFCYLNYKPNDFVIKLRDIWKWLGYGRLNECNRKLTNNFKLNKDYVLAEGFVQIGTKPNLGENGKNVGGRPKKETYISVNTFKRLCLLSGTKKSREIHEYYIKLEEKNMEIIQKQMFEMKKQLANKDQEILTNKEKTLIDAYHKKKVLYLFSIEETTMMVGSVEKTVRLKKFGWSNNVKRRRSEHIRDIGLNIKLEYVVECIYNIELEKMIKKNLGKHIISKVYNDKIQTEILQFDDEFSEEIFYNEINKYKDSFNDEEMIIKFLEENENLKKENIELKEEINSYIPIEKPFLNLQKKLQNKNEIKKKNEIKNAEYEREKEKIFLKFLENIMKDYEDNSFAINNKKVYKEYGNFNILHDLSMTQLGVKLFKCPGIKGKKVNKIWCKYFNKILVNEWIEEQRKLIE